MQPDRLTIADLHVDSPVVPLGVTDGALDVPEDVHTIGWWKGGARPGASTGTAVLAGHVDSHVQGIGTLFYLETLPMGSRVVIGTDGGHLTYRVVARHVYVKKQGLPTDLFRTDGAPRLVLITCGGPFDAATRQYADNVVVYAVPT